MAHVKAYGASAAVGILRHNERTPEDKAVARKNECIISSLTCQNRVLSPAREKPLLEHINTVAAQSGVIVSTRKDLNVLADWVVTLPKDVKTVDTQRFFDETYKFLCARYGGEQFVLSSVVHMDETTPHLHHGFVPVATRADGTTRSVSSKAVLTRKELLTFHKDLSEYMERALGYPVAILNEATKTGNKSIEELKQQPMQVPEGKRTLLGKVEFDARSAQELRNAAEVSRHALLLSKRLERENEALREQLTASREDSDKKASLVQQSALDAFKMRQKLSMEQAANKINSFGNKLRYALHGEIPPELMDEARKKVYQARRCMKITSSGAGLVKMLAKHNIDAKVDPKKGILLRLSDGTVIRAETIDKRMSAAETNRTLEQNKENYKSRQQEKRMQEQQETLLAEAEELLKRKLPSTLEQRSAVLERLQHELALTISEVSGLSTPEEIKGLRDMINEIKISSSEWQGPIENLSNKVDTLLNDCTTLHTRQPKEKLSDYLERTQEQREQCIAVLEEIKGLGGDIREELADIKDKPERYGLLRELAQLREEVFAQLDNDVLATLLREMYAQQACMNMLQLFSDCIEDTRPRSNLEQLADDLSAQALKELRIKKEIPHTR